MVRLNSLALATAAVIYGGFALGNGGDRLSEAKPSIQRLVPALFRASANVAAAETAVSRKDYAEGEDSAKRAMARSPLNRDAVGILALSRLLTNKDEAADAAFRVSGQLGWRDVPTQLYWYQIGQQSSDLTLMAQRADAVLRANPRYAQIQTLLQPLEATPEGRTALLARMVERPKWLNNVAQPVTGKDLAELERRTEMLREMEHHNISLGCGAVNDITFQLVDNGMRAAALDVWSGHCSQKPTRGNLFDGQFQALSADRRSPFDWRTQASGDVDVRTSVQADGKRAAEVSNLSPFVVPILAQTVDLKPGRYRAHLDPGNPAAARGRLFATLSCGPNPVRKGESKGDLLGEGMIVVAEKCPLQVFGIWLRPGQGDLVLKRITLDPVP